MSDAEQLAAARQALIRTGYFRPDEVSGDQVASRIAELFEVVTCLQRKDADDLVIIERRVERALVLARALQDQDPLSRTPARIRKVVNAVVRVLAPDGET